MLKKLVLKMLSHLMIYFVAFATLQSPECQPESSVVIPKGLYNSTDCSFECDENHFISLPNGSENVLIDHGYIYVKEGADTTYKYADGVITVPLGDENRVCSPRCPMNADFNYCSFSVKEGETLSPDLHYLSPGDVLIASCQDGAETINIKLNCNNLGFFDIGTPKKCKIKENNALLSNSYLPLGEHIITCPNNFEVLEDSTVEIPTYKVNCIDISETSGENSVTTDSAGENSVTTDSAGENSVTTDSAGENTVTTDSVDENSDENTEIPIINIYTNETSTPCKSRCLENPKDHYLYLNKDCKNKPDGYECDGVCPNFEMGAKYKCKDGVYIGQFCRKDYGLISYFAVFMGCDFIAFLYCSWKKLFGKEEDKEESVVVQKTDSTPDEAPDNTPVDAPAAAPVDALNSTPDDETYYY